MESDTSLQDVAGASEKEQPRDSVPGPASIVGTKRSAEEDLHEQPTSRLKIEDSATPGSNGTASGSGIPIETVPVATLGVTLPTPADQAPSSEAAESNIPYGDPPISKSMQKKLRKHAEWEAKRDERKVIRKERAVRKREQRKSERKRLAEDPAHQPGPLPAPGKKIQPKRAAQLPITFLIDCDFDDLMRDPERKSLALQITRCYSDNKKAKCRAHLAICSFGGQLRERFDNVLSHYKGWKNVRFLDCDFVKAAEEAKEWMRDEEQKNALGGTFAPLASDESDPDVTTKLQDEGEVIYLTSEADDTLTELKPYSTYIIGGLVDKNREKGICYKRARQRGVKTAKLPIREFMDMQSRQVLATNHVNEIMLKWLECGDWGEAFLAVIPKRKGGLLKARLRDEGDDASGVTGDENEDDVQEHNGHSDQDAQIIATPPGVETRNDEVSVSEPL